MQKQYRASRHSASALASPDKLSLVVTLNDVGLEYVQGLISKRSEMVPYGKINSVNVLQGPLEKSLDYGTVIIVTGNDVEPIRLVDIENPHGLKDDLESMMQAVYAQAPVPPSPEPVPAAPTPPAPPLAPVPAQTPEDEIVKLASLRDQGIITQDDFDRKKAQLLGL